MKYDKHNIKIAIKIIMYLDNNVIIIIVLTSIMKLFRKRNEKIKILSLKSEFFF